MNKAALTSSDRRDNVSEQRHPSNPFATPNANPIPSPKPCARPPYKPSDLPASSYIDSAHNGVSYKSSHKPASFSSSGGSSTKTPMSSIDLEKRSSPKSHSRKRAAKDPEKAMGAARNDSHQPTFMGDATTVAFSDDDEEVDPGRQMQEQKAVKILLFLSGPCVVLSSLNMAWCWISLAITILSQPVRLCARRPTFGQELAGLLGPTLNLQLKSIYTPLPPHANEDGSYHTFMLVMVHLLSPFLSLGIMIAAWGLAVYWASSVVVGDPAGKDNRDDGRETVLGLRKWWERWLKCGVKDE